MKKIPQKAEINFILQSALYELPLVKSDSLDGVITSPPYCNRYDYTSTYALELVYLGLGEQDIKIMRQNLLTCTVENKPKIEALRQYYFSIGEIKRFNYIYSIINNNKPFTEIIHALAMRKDNGYLNNNGILRMV